MEITPEELNLKLQQGEKIILLDVREPDEYEICHLPNSTLIPMRTLPGRIQELNPKDSIVVYCHHGPRSMQVTMWLRAQGFEKALNLQGGIDAWADLIDPKMDRY